jgi:hypothetical protein
MSKIEPHQIARIALVLNLFGSVLLAYAFEITPSDVRFVSMQDGATAICKQDIALLILEPNGSWQLGSLCPESGASSEAAVFKTNHPRFFRWGLRLIIMATLLGLWSQQPLKLMNRAEQRRQLRLALRSPKR